MSETARPSGLFRDIATDPQAKAAILADAGLSVDEFAERHGPTIRRHYAKGGYALDYEDGHQAAATLWRYLREP